MPRHDLKFVATAAVVCAVVVLAVPVTAIRAIGALPLCLVLPGYVITAAVFARIHLEVRQTLMLTLALSLVTLVLGSLVLDLAPGGLRRGSWTILLVLVVLSGAEVARRRRPDRPMPPRRVRRLGVRATDAILLVAAGVLAVGAFALSRTPLGARNAVGYTQLWAMTTGTARTAGLVIGVKSQEQHTTNYRLELKLEASDGVTDQRISLRPGQQDRLVIPLLRAGRGSSAMLTATLYKSGSSIPYRQVTANLRPVAAGS